MNRSRGAGQPPAARFTSQWELGGQSSQGSAKDGYTTDGVLISYSDIESIKNDVEGGVKIVFKNGIRKIIPHPESEDFLEWYIEQNEERAESVPPLWLGPPETDPGKKSRRGHDYGLAEEGSMDDTQVESAIDQVLKEDYGDIPLYLNLYDLFDLGGAENQVVAHQQLKDTITSLAYGPEWEAYLKALKAKVAADPIVKQRLADTGTSLR